jgi:hypothetical protein
MRKIVRLTMCVSVIFAGMFVSCKKNSSEGKSIGLTVEDAKSSLQRLESKYGNYDIIKMSDDKTTKSFKTVDFSKAYVGENATSFFVEAPISYTTREIVLNADPYMPKAMLNKMFKNSFDRFVVYKDKMSGLVSEKIVTVIPSDDYISKGKKDLHNIHFQNIAKDFSGYVINKSWKGKFLSSQSYNLGNDVSGNGQVLKSDTKDARVNDVSCNYETYYRGYAWCEDFDENGNGVNCDYIIIEYQGMVCDIVDPVTHNHSAPLPDTNDPYWDWAGWPPGQGDPPPSTCPTGPRYTESPILYAAIAQDGLSFSVTIDGMCECPGYSFIILEDVATGTQYDFPIEVHNIIRPDCPRYWETNALIPASVPNGTYFINCWFDGDLFTHSVDKDGVITTRFRHTLQR